MAYCLYCYTEDDDPVFMTALPHEFVTATETSAEDPLFMTARPDSIQDPLFMTAREFPAELEDSGENNRPSAISHEPSVEKEHSKTSFNMSNASSKTVSVHSSLDMHLTCPISPTSSIENALTPLSVQALSGKLHHLIEHRAEDSLSSISSYNDKPPFMMGEVSGMRCLVAWKICTEIYVDIYVLDCLSMIIMFFCSIPAHGC